MSLAWKLALAHVRHSPARIALTSLAMIASACVVVWVVSGYDALTGKMGDDAAEYLGRFDLFIVPDEAGESAARVPAALIEQLRREPSVAELSPVWQVPVGVQNENAPMMPGGGTPGKMPGKQSGGAGKQGPSGRPPMGFGAAANLVGTDAAEPPYQLQEGRWIRHGDEKLRETVISNIVAERYSFHVSDECLVICGPKEFRLKVVGITRQSAAQPISTQSQVGPSGRPMMRMPTGSAVGPAAAALYVPMPLAERIARRPAQCNLVNIKLASGVGADKFRGELAARVATMKPAVLVLGVADLKAAMSEGMAAGGARRKAWAATGMSLLAALFIIFTTLSMGVNERVRQLAVMRAVGLTRGQVARLVAAEGVLLAVIGWLGGLIAGWIMLRVAAARIEALQDASLGWWCVMLTGVSALGGALMASVLPAWQATRVAPLDALSPKRSARPNLLWASVFGIVGLLLVGVGPAIKYSDAALNVVLWLFSAFAPDTRHYLAAALSYFSAAVGFLLLAPWTIMAVEAIFGQIIARLMRLEPKLLAWQLSGNLWRTLGTTAALTVGLGLYVSMMVWGYSMLQPFTPGRWAPDVLAAFQQGGLPEEEMAEVRKLPGVAADQCLPLAVEQPRLADDLTDSGRGQSVTRQDNVIIIGLDAAKAFCGSSPLMRMDFVSGTPDAAAAKLKAGRWCVVPDHFLEAAGLKVGDSFSLLPPESPGKKVEYKIAGVVKLPGWHWMTKFSGLRRRSGRSAAMVFADYEQVRRDFGVKQINFIWMNMDKEFVARHQKEAGAEGDDNSAAVDALGNSLRPIADRNLGEQQPVNAQGTMPFGALNFGQSLRLSTPVMVRQRITARADDWIWALCELPLVTLLVASLAVVNTVMASVRARRWEHGVMRAVGVTRWCLMRMVLAEGLLIGLAACLLSLAFGVVAGWCGTGLTRHIDFFGGLETPLVVPWSHLTLGFGLAIGLSLLAALWPAVSTGRAEPLKLLQAGRAAM